MMKYKYFIGLLITIVAAFLFYFLGNIQDLSEDRQYIYEKKKETVLYPTGKIDFPTISTDICLKIPKDFNTNEVEIPNNKDIFTQNEYKKTVVYPFLKKWLTQGHNYKNHLLYDAACRGIAGLLTIDQKKTVIKNAKKILEINQYDEITLLALYHSDKKYFSNYEWTRRFKESTNGKVYEYIRYELYKRYYWTDKNPNRIAGWLPLALYKNFTNIELTPREAQYVFRLIKSHIGNAKWHIKYAKKLMAKNSYLGNLLLGNFYIELAWSYRGNGWGSSVTDKGWNMFEKYLELSQKHLLKAYEMHNFMPEAAAEMITYCMAKDKENLYLWANRALAAQVDYRAIYKKLSMAMRPRWCGSLIDQIILADKCCQSELCNTIVPEMGLDMYQTVVEDCHYRDWEKIYNRPSILEKIKKMLNGLEQYDNKNKNIYGGKVHSHDYYQALLASYYFYAGKYQKAKNIIDKMGLEEFSKLEDCLLKKRYYANFYRVSQRINFYTGRFAKEFISAQKDYISGKDNEAIYRMEKLLKEDDLTENERNFIVSMWGHYSLGAEPKEYCDFRSPLIVAAVIDRMDIAQKLIKLGVDINEKDAFGRNALYCSVSEDHSMKWLKFLVENGADINTKCNRGYSILFNVAYESDKIEEIKYILANGGNPNIKNNKGFSSIHSAVSGGNLDNLKILIVGGADVKATSDNGYNALFSCHPEKNGLEIAKFLINKNLDVNNKMDLNNKNDNKNDNINVLYYLADKEEATELIRFFIKHGANPNIEGKFGFTPLMKAIDCNELENVKALVDGGANINAVSSINLEGSIREHAARRNNAKITKYLEDHGMN